MSNNTSTSFPETSRPMASLSSRIVHGCFIGEGTLMVVGNALLITIILSTKSLRRKELLILGGLALGDLLYGIGYFFGGIHRLKLSIQGVHTELVSPWECMKAVQSTFFIVGSQAAAFMLVAVSADRLLAVRWYAYYMHLNNRYARTVMLSIYGYISITLAVFFLLSYFVSSPYPGVSAICISTQVGPSWLSFYQPTVQMGCGLLSILLYLLSLWHYRKHMKESGQTGSQQQSAGLIRQKKMTKIVGITVLITFITYAFPHGVILVLNTVGFGKNIASMFSPYMWVLSAINSISNILVLAVCHKEIRTIIASLLKCKKPMLQPTTQAGSTHGKSKSRLAAHTPANRIVSR